MTLGPRGSRKTSSFCFSRSFPLSQRPLLILNFRPQGGRGGACAVTATGSSPVTSSLQTSYPSQRLLQKATSHSFRRSSSSHHKRFAGLRWDFPFFFQHTKSRPCRRVFDVRGMRLLHKITIHLLWTISKSHKGGLTYFPPHFTI